MDYFDDVLAIIEQVLEKLKGFYKYLENYFKNFNDEADPAEAE